MIPAATAGRERLPAYLTSPGHAIAERQRWQNRLEREMVQALTAHLESLTTGPVTAAAFPHWARAVARWVSGTVRVPGEFLQRLLVAEPVDDSATPAEIAARLAPTLATATYNAHVLAELAAGGYGFKQWVTRRDDRVRPAHHEADYQTVPLSSPFLVGGYPLQYPADSRTAPIGLWVNCRCVTVGRTGP